MAGHTLPKWAVAQAFELFGGGGLSYEGFFSRERDLTRLPEGLPQVLEAVDQCRRETPGAESLETWVYTSAIFVQESVRRYSVDEVEYRVGSAVVGPHSLLQDLSYEHIEDRVRAAARSR
jgi:hypothetical protein